MGQHCHVCQKILKKGEKVYSTIEGKITKKGIYTEEDSDPLIVCEKCGKELEDAVKTLKNFNETNKMEKK